MAEKVEKPTAPKPEVKATADEARALIERDRTDREAKCLAAIQGAIEEFGCDMDISVMVTTRGNEPHLKVIAR